MDKPMNWPQFVLDTIRDPQWAAQTLIGMQLPRAVLYQMLLAACALNALLATGSTMLNPPTFELPPLLTNPLSYFALLAGGVLIMTHLLFWAGRALGGTGAFEEVLAVMAWLQVIRFILQALVFVTSLVLAPLALLLALAAGILGLWLLVQFVTTAHRYESPWRAVGLLIATSTGLILGIALILSLIGGTNLGIEQNV